MGYECKAKREGNPSTPLRPLVATEEDHCGRHSAYEREAERMRDGAMAEGRRIGNVQQPPDNIDVWQGGACRGNDAHTPRGHSGLSPGRDSKANSGV